MAGIAAAVGSRREARTAWMAAGLFAVALGVRLANIAALRGVVFFEHPTMDEAYHVQWAAEVARGQVFEEAPFYRAPLYPMLLGAVRAVAGEQYFVMRALSAVCGAATVVVIWLLARRLFGSLAGAVSAGAAAFYSRMIFYDFRLLTTSLECLLFTLGLLLGVRALEGRRAWWPVGVLLGLGAITRPTVLPFIALVGAVLLWKRRRVGLARGAVGYAAGVAAMVLPVTAVNFFAGREAILIAWNGGINFYLGNNASANGIGARAAEIDPTWWGGYRDTIRIASEAAGRELSYGDVDSYWYRRGWSYVAESPGAAAFLWVRKLTVLLGAAEFPNNQSSVPFIESSVWLRLIRYEWVLPLAVLGLLALLLERRTGSWLPVLFVLAYGAALLTFFVNSRYRMPLIPAMLVFAGNGVASIVDLARSRQFGGLVVAALVGGFAFLATQLRPAELATADRMRGHFEAAAACVEAGRIGEAEAHVAALRSAGADRPGVALTEALVLHAKGEGGQADRVLRQRLEDEPRDYDAAALLGWIRLRQGDAGGAEAMLRRAIELHRHQRVAVPGYLSAWVGEALALRGDGDGARRAWAEARTADPEFAPAYVAAAELERREGRPDEALRLLREAAGRRRLWVYTWTGSYQPLPGGSEAIESLIRQTEGATRGAQEPISAAAASDSSKLVWTF